jgi:hypothetical protein
VQRYALSEGESTAAQPNSDIEADEALGRFAPSGLRSLMPVVILTHLTSARPGLLAAVRDPAAECRLRQRMRGRTRRHARTGRPQRTHVAHPRHAPHDGHAPHAPHDRHARTHAMARSLARAFVQFCMGGLAWTFWRGHLHARSIAASWAAPKAAVLRLSRAPSPSGRSRVLVFCETETAPGSRCIAALWAAPRQRCCPVRASSRNATVDGRPRAQYASKAPGA